MFKQSRFITFATEIFAVAALVAPVALATPVYAGESDPFTDIRQVTVNYSDIDLNQQAGGEQLFRRLKIAAGRACRRSGDRQLSNAYRQCRTEALAQAVRDVGHPTLTAAWQGPTMLAGRDGTSGG